MKKHNPIIGKFRCGEKSKESYVMVDLYDYQNKTFFNLYFTIDDMQLTMPLLGKIQSETNLKIKVKAETTRVHGQVHHRFIAHIYNVLENWDITIKGLEQFKEFEITEKDLGKIKAMSIIKQL
jgi:hypothetical protein